MKRERDRERERRSHVNYEERPSKSIKTDMEEKFHPELDGIEGSKEIFLGRERKRKLREKIREEREMRECCPHTWSRHQS